MIYKMNIKEFMDKKKKKKIILFTLNDFFISYITTLYGKLTSLIEIIPVSGTTDSFSGINTGITTGQKTVISALSKNEQ